MSHEYIYAVDARVEEERYHHDAIALKAETETQETQEETPEIDRHPDNLHDQQHHQQQHHQQHDTDDHHRHTEHDHRHPESHHNHHQHHRHDDDPREQEHDTGDHHYHQLHHSVHHPHPSEDHHHVVVAQNHNETPDSHHQPHPSTEDLHIVVAQNHDEIVESEDKKDKDNKGLDDSKDSVVEDVIKGVEDVIKAPVDVDPKVIAQNKLIEITEPTTELEKALKGLLGRKEFHIERLTNEIRKLRAFISKRKQTYKRKRKEDGAPTRALSGYNIFINERFAQLAKKNEEALKSEDTDAVMERVPPSDLLSATGNEWKELSAEEKMQYEERAKEDRKRYEEQMAQYQPPDKQCNRKRNKTGYNMFFSAHVLRLKQTESGVPSERGSVARIVGTAWKLLSNEEKQYYEREADKHNGMNPVKEGEEEDEEEEVKRHHMEHHYMHPPPHEMVYAQPVHPPPPVAPMHPATMHQQHDPRALHGASPPQFYSAARPTPPSHHHYHHPPPPPPLSSSYGGVGRHATPSFQKQTQQHGSPHTPVDSHKTSSKHYISTMKGNKPRTMFAPVSSSQPLENWFGV